MEGLTVAPLAFLIDRLVVMDGFMFLDLYTQWLSQITVTFYFFVPLVFAALILLRPVAQYTYTFHIQPSQQRFLQMVNYMTIFFGYFVYVESATYIDLKVLLTFLCMAYLVPCE